jgi:hypothetical protein
LKSKKSEADGILHILIPQVFLAGYKNTDADNMAP